MKVVINQPVGFTEVGQRTNNEDCIFPAIGSASANSRLFLVCDGVGGQHKGEVASALACESISLFFEQNPVAVANEEYIARALKFTVERFNARESADRETAGMATTLTLLHLNDAGATLAHLGDSRIYQVRNGQVIYASKDHKLVNELVRDGHITEEEATSHSQRNVITKVISADRHDVPDVDVISDITAGDYFFLCTDGVLEQMYDELLAYHLRETEDNDLEDNKKMDHIRSESLGKTRDNFSAYLIRIQSVTGGVSAEPYPNAHNSRPPRSPVPVPVRTRDIRTNYENDAPTEFTRAGLQQLRGFDNGTPQAKKSPLFNNKDLKKKTGRLPYIAGIVVGIAAIATAAWYWKQPPLKVVTQPHLTIQPAAAPTPDKPLAAKISRNTASPDAGSEKPRAQRPSESLEIIDQSKNQKFNIIKDLGKFYVWEPSENKKIEIIYDDIVSIKGVVHYYYQIQSKKHYLYLVKPDLSIPDIDPNKKIETSADRVIYFSKGVEHKINPESGNDLMPTLNDLK